MKITWLEDAAYDLKALRFYISQDKTRAANKVVESIINKIKLLSQQPNIGRPGRVFDTRELVISGTPYIVPYQVKENAIIILRVLHCAMQWPEEF